MPLFGALNSSEDVHSPFGFTNVKSKGSLDSEPNQPLLRPIIKALFVMFIKENILHDVSYEVLLYSDGPVDLIHTLSPAVNKWIYSLLAITCPERELASPDRDTSWLLFITRLQSQPSDAAAPTLMLKLV